jgi:hypothetical protein
LRAPLEDLASRSEASARLARLSLQVAGAVLRLPCLALLVILEPLVKVLLAGSALLLTFTALLFALLRPVHAVPIGGMLAVAAGAVLVLAGYYAFLRALSV